jgi:putative RNA 2'-phosphotransferase
MDVKREKSLSKFLSLLLRHKPQLIGLELDKNGWANVDELIEKSKTKGKIFNFEELKYIVKNCNKQRYTFNRDFTKIRANQGHSINVELDLHVIEPPAILYHGTAEKNLSSIMQNGLVKQNRQHVHLSLDVETATKVGQRHGKVIILVVKSGKMHADGIKFYLSKNKVWLTDFVDPKYIELFKL